MSNETERKKENNKFIYAFEARLESEHAIVDETQNFSFDTYFTAFTCYMMKGYKYHITGDVNSNIQ